MILKSKRKISKKRREKIIKLFFTLKKEDRKDGKLISPTTHVQNLIGEEVFIVEKVKESSSGDVSVNFYINVNFESNAIHKSKNDVDCIFNENENK